MLNKYFIGVQAEHWSAFEDETPGLVDSLKLIGALMDGRKLIQMCYTINTNEATLLYLKIKYALIEDNILDVTDDQGVELCPGTHLA